MKSSRAFVFFAVGVFLASISVNSQVWCQNQFMPLAAGDIKIEGYAGDRIAACINNGIMKTSIPVLVSPFRIRTETRFWQTEFWGKYVAAACAAYNYTKDKSVLDRLNEAAEGLMATQSPDGYIGNYRPDFHLQEWDIWGRKYCLLGLLAFYDITKNRTALIAAGKLADHLIAEIGGRNISDFGNFRGMAASSVLEPMVSLYNHTGQLKYLEFAESIVAGWEKGNGPRLISNSLRDIPVAARFAKPKRWFSPENGQKAYEMMSCYEGLLELYKVTKKEEYKLAVEKAVKNIIDSEMMVIGSGSSLECWYGGRINQAIPARNMNETCVTATWLRLCNRLLQLTGDPSYADNIEQTFYNALLGSMSPDGSSWSKYSELNGHRHYGEMQCGMPMNCCIASGPRGMMVIPQVAVMRDKAGAVINFFGMVKAKLNMEGSDVSIIQQSNYPASNIVEIAVEPEKSIRCEVKIRIPSWSSNTVLMINGDTLKRPAAGSYAVVNKKWSRGDKIKLVLDMHGRLVESQDKRHFAIQYGPLVLAADERVTPGVAFNYYEPVADKSGRMQCSVIEHPSQHIYFMAKVPFLTAGQQTELTLLDYASAGNTWDKASGYMTWLPRLWDLRQ